MPLKYLLLFNLLFAFSMPIFSQDSTRSISLLPKPLGPMESMLWSEKGALRTLFDFPLTPEGREHEMTVRRNMLGLHQFGGFATFAALLTTVTLGQLVYNGHRDLSQAHKAMAFTSVAGYFTVATLALFTPPPMIRRGEWSTISTHKLLATLHFTGMLAMPVLGTIVRKEMVRDGHSDLAPIHLGVGYATVAAFGAAMLIISF